MNKLLFGPEYGTISGGMKKGQPDGLPPGGSGAGYLALRSSSSVDRPSIIRETPSSWVMMAAKAAGLAKMMAARITMTRPQIRDVKKKKPFKCRSSMACTNIRQAP